VASNPGEFVAGAGLKIPAAFQNRWLLRGSLADPVVCGLAGADGAECLTRVSGTQADACPIAVIPISSDSGRKTGITSTIRSRKQGRLSGITHRIPYPERAFYGRRGSMRANLSSTWATAATDVAVEIGFSGIWRLLPDDNSHDKRRLPLHFLDFR
jgi:hypothetical protein